MNELESTAVVDWLHPAASHARRIASICGGATLVIGGNIVKILAWYDNEWGFSNRLVDLAVFMDKKGL